MSPSRPYRMTARVASREETRTRILDAAVELFLTGWYDEVTVRGVAAHAGVSPQTVVTHFGTKDALFVAALERFSAERGVRDAAPVDDVPAATRILVEDYDRIGDANIRALALEPRFPVLAAALDGARASHGAWCARTFPGALVGLTGAARRRRLVQLQAATDVLMWKLLRRDHGLSRPQTTVAMTELVESLYPGST